MAGCLNIDRSVITPFSDCSRLQNIRESASRKVARKSRGSWRVSIVFNTSFWYTSSWYTLYDWSILTIYVNHSRFSKKFPGISQKVAQKLFKKQLKVAFCDENPQKLLEKNKTFLGLMLKYTNCTDKSKISKHFLQFCGVNSVSE